MLSKDLLFAMNDITESYLEDTRKALGYTITRDLLALQQQLAGAQPTTDAEQRDFYEKMAAKFPV